MGSPLALVPAVDFRTVRIESPHSIVLIKNGQAVDQMTPENALAYAAVIIGQAKKAQEMQPKVAQRVIEDGALLLRAGVPLGLSNNPKILAETVKHARDDRDLRRYLPGGIKSTEQVGAPAVIRHEPPAPPSEE